MDHIGWFIATLRSAEVTPNWASFSIRSKLFGGKGTINNCTYIPDEARFLSL